jgi:stress-induced-phosphoprotein 1
MKANIISTKDRGNSLFKIGDFEGAIKRYTTALEDNPSDHTIYGNRSASYHNLKHFEKALEDGEKCVQLNPSWAKGF